MFQDAKGFIVKNRKEILFQSVLFGFVFLIYINRPYHSPDNKLEDFVFFLNYALCSYFISYYLMPKYFYNNKKTLFYLFFILINIVAILIEELVIEKIYYPNSRGSGSNLLDLSYLTEMPPYILALTFFKFIWDLDKKQSQIEQFRMLVQESELQFLKSQINPHFLFNSLNNLYSYALKNSNKTPSIILDLSSVLRYILYECKEKFVVLNKELGHLKDYTALNELQIEERGDVNIEVINLSNNYVIAPLILMVFIENAFKHSTASQSENIIIDITIYVNEAGQITFSCKNSFTQNTNTNNLDKGIGLVNVKKRLNLLYPNKHTLNVFNTNNSYNVILTLNLSEAC